MDKFARLDDITGLGINEGFCFGDGQFICASEEEALKAAKEMGYETLQEAYDDEAYYWTEWEIEEDENWYSEDGKEYTNCHKCGEETVVLEEFYFCTHCLTHL